MGFSGTGFPRLLKKRKHLFLKEKELVRWSPNGYVNGFIVSE
jgi:hypothetical protein